MSEGPVRVAIASTPSPGGEDGAGALAHEVELAKAAILYADEVEMVSLSAAMVDGLRVATQGDMGFANLLGALDQDTIAHLVGDGQQLPEDWQDQLQTMMRLDPDAIALVDENAADQLREIKDEFKELAESSQRDLDALLEDMGASELLPAIKANVLTIADLAVTPASVLRPPSLGPGATDTDALIWGWIDTLIQRMNSKRVRLLFDDTAAGLVQSMLDAGLIPPSEAGSRLAAQASIGAGFMSRLPAFPNAPMDELLDLRQELSAPLVRYRAAVIRFSRDIPQLMLDGLDFEVQQLWEAQVVPELTTIEEQLVDHGLVRELARSVSAQDIRNFGTWTAGTHVLLDFGTDLSSLASGLVATAATGATRGGQVILDAYRQVGAARRSAEANNFYYLYEANRRMAE